MKKWFTLCCFILLAANSFAKTIYVKANASGANDGTSWINAFSKLQDALSNVLTGDQLWVAAGTYYPDEGVGLPDNNRLIAFSMKNGVAIYGGFAGNETQLSERNWTANITILSGEIGNLASTLDNSNAVIRNTGVNATAILNGFTITGGYATSEGDNPPQGGGMSNFSSSPTVANCIFTLNRALQHGGAVSNSGSSPTFSNCLFLSNFATNFGGGLYNSTSSPTLINCNFVKNGSFAGSAIYIEASSSTAVTNCIVWGNTSNFGGQIMDNSSTSSFSYSILQGGYPGTGNLNKDPLFVDAANNNFHLQPCSPAINAGTSTGAPTSDLDANPRPALGGYDMGVYEFQGTVATGIVYVNAAATGSNDGSSWTNAFTKLQDALTKSRTCFDVAQIWVAKGTYYPDEGGGFSNNDRNASFTLKNSLSVYGGFAGTETQLGQRNWTTNVTILSGDLTQNDGSDFANNSDNALNVVTCNLGTDNTAILDGFTITGGNANASPATTGGGILNFQSSASFANCIVAGNTAQFNGGGVYNAYSSSVFSNCSFEKNKAGEGGGALWNEVSPTKLTSCIFKSNQSPNGGAVYNYYAAATITNCVFSKNSAGIGAAIWGYESSAQIINSSFYGNSADISGGAVYNYSSSPSATNCIFWGNTAAGNASQISNAVESVPVISYSIVQGGYASGTNILDKDPLFVNAVNNDLHLQACSPAIDSGLNSANNSSLDLDGNARINHTTIDLGAYEYSGTLYTYYIDKDKDSYGSGGEATNFCSTAPPGYASNNDDCDDNNATINPTIKWYKDADNDGYSDGNTITQCGRPAGYKLLSELTAASGDCKDDNAAVNPGKAEICGNGIDDNCNGQVDENCGSCKNATGLTTTNIAANAAKLNWVAAVNPAQWQVEYKTIATGSKWTNITLAGSTRSITISSLIANQQYQWHIRAKCGTKWTDYTGVVKFKTLCSSGKALAKTINEEQLSPDGENTFKVYPNPSNGQFRIALSFDDNSSSVAKAELIDIAGKKILTETISLNKGAGLKNITIPSSVAGGMYLVRITAGNKIVVSKLIYQK